MSRNTTLTLMTKTAAQHFVPPPDTALELLLRICSDQDARTGDAGVLLGAARMRLNYQLLGIDNTNATPQNLTPLVEQLASLFAPSPVRTGMLLWGLLRDRELLPALPAAAAQLDLTAIENALRDGSLSSTEDLSRWTEQPARSTPFSIAPRSDNIDHLPLAPGDASYYRAILRGGHSGSACCNVSGVFLSLPELVQALDVQMRLMVLELEFIVEGYVNGRRAFETTNPDLELRAGATVIARQRGAWFHGGQAVERLDEALLEQLALHGDAVEMTLDIAPIQASSDSFRQYRFNVSDGEQPWGWVGHLSEGESR